MKEDYAQRAGSPRTTTDTAMSRIDNDVQTLRQAADTVTSIRNRLMRHARSLGYFEPPKDASSTVEPVITTLADAISNLQREIEHTSGALNVFD